jgi:hypothetical protein
MRTDLTPQAIAALNSGAMGLCLLLEMGYSPVVYLNSSAVAIEFAGNTYLGAGSLGSVDSITNGGGQITGLNFSLSGVPTESIALALTESARNKSCKLRLGIFDADTTALLDAPVIFTGVLDQMPITEDLREGQVGTSVLGVTAIHIGQLYSRPKPLRYNMSDQQRLYPGDTSMRFLVSQAGHKDVWPSKEWGRK